MNIGIIGAGPAGIFAALEASKRHEHVTIIDSNPSPGRKLAATGAGRGNLTNVNVAASAYASIEKFSYEEIIREFDYEFLHSYLNQNGIYIYQTDDGWCYPISNSAKNVAEYLAKLLEINRIEIKSSCNVTDILATKGKFTLFFENEKPRNFDRLIVASGGCAHPQLNASDKLLLTLAKMGHNTISARPALAPIKTTKKFSRHLSGVRLDARLTIEKKGRPVVSSFGNIIFTEWGVNGPGAMNISHYINEGESELKLQFDFTNTATKQLIGSFNSTQSTNILSLDTLLLPIYPLKLIDQISENAKLSGYDFSKSPDSMALKISGYLVFSEKITGTRGFQFAQVSTGAVSSSNINPKNLESKITQGLFFAGEILDVIGPCGGYNLHWAFVSGIVAGRAV